MSVNVITVSLGDVVIIPQATKEYNLLTFLLLFWASESVPVAILKKKWKKGTPPVHSFNFFLFHVNEYKKLIGHIR